MQAATAANTKAALRANRALQRVVREQLQRVQNADRMLERQASALRAEEARMAQRREAAGTAPAPASKASAWASFRVTRWATDCPYFRGTRNVATFAPNSARLKRVRAHSAFAPPSWTFHEDEVLRRGVKRWVQHALLNAALSECSSSSSSSSSASASAASSSVPRLVPRAASLSTWVDAIESMADHAVAVHAAARLGEGEWRQLAASALSGRRSGESCAARWKHCVSPIADRSAKLGGCDRKGSATELERLERAGA
jgi:hypothetical protein